MAVTAVARAALRSRWRYWVGLGVLIAIAGGGVVALAAGARRTSSAYPRFLQAQRAEDARVFVGAPGPQPRDVQAAPEVADSSVLDVLASSESDFVPVVPDARFGVELDRFKFLAGRAPDPDRSDEAVVGFVLARARHLSVGATLTVHLLTPDPTTASFTVVGIEAVPLEFPPQSTQGGDGVYLSRGFLSTAAGAKAAQLGTPAVLMRLRHGAAGVNLLRQELFPTRQRALGMVAAADQTDNVERSFRLEVTALWIVAGFAALAGLLVLAQLLAREMGADADERAALSALGMTSGQLFAARMLLVGLTGAAGAAGASALAYLASPLLPVGTARIAEPRPGLTFDAVALGLGFLAILVAVGGLGAAVVGLATARGHRHGPSSTATWHPATLARLPLVASSGIRMALQAGRGRGAVPVRTTLAAVAIAVGAMAAALTFGAGLSHLLATPTLYGATFDTHVEGNGNFTDLRPIVPTLTADPAIEAAMLGGTGVPLAARGVSFGGQYMSEVVGAPIPPPLRSGRLPVGASEIALGSQTLRALHAKLGDTVGVSVPGIITTPIPMRIVGVVVLPAVNDAEELGRGAVIAPGFLSFLPAGFQVPPPGTALVRFRPGVDDGRALATVQREVGSIALAYPPLQPVDVANFGQVSNLPEILAGLLGLIAVATIAHLLLSSVRRRRGELAVLKTLGLVPRQVFALVAWQATTISVVAAVIGVPIGVAGGRWAWIAVANGLGVVPSTSVPVLLVLGLIPAAAVVANLVAAAPAASAGRVSPAMALRAE